MRILGNLTRELETVSPEVAMRMVEPLYQQPAVLVIGACMFIGIGIVGFFATGSSWYLAGAAASLVCCVWRLGQIYNFRSQPQSRTPAQWARGAFGSFWLQGAVWGAWSFVVPFETERYFDFMIVSTQCICILGATVRNSGVPAVVIGQVVLALLPPLFICALSHSRYMNAFTPFVILNFLGGVSMIRFLHEQRLNLLLADEEKSSLLERLSASNQDLELANRHLAALAASDGLTGLANRRAFDLALIREWRRMARARQPMALLLMDVDHFKAFNDRYGHPAGDEALRLIAAAADAAMRRPGDLLARYGGEEFVAILPATDMAAAMSVAERVRQNVEGIDLAHGASRWAPLTVSIGVASVVPEPDGAGTALIDRADAALYAAKTEGRNRVRSAA